MKKSGPNLYECLYVPQQPGNYVINVTYGGQHVSKSPFKVNVGPYKESRIRAYGPGLIGGVVGYPAVFTVETNGETGALGKNFGSSISTQVEMDAVLFTGIVPIKLQGELPHSIIGGGGVI